VAGDVHHQGLSVQPQPKFYWPFSLRTDDDQTYVLKTAVDPSSVFSAVQAAVWAIDPSILMTRIATLDDLISESVARPRFMAVLVFALATLAAVLAVVGVFGVLAYTVAQRTHEIGVRIALGAETNNVILAVLRRGLTLVGTGLAIGFGLALVAARVLESTLFEVSPWDATTLLAVALLLTTAAIAASSVPARRATRVDPVEALRQE
jgi:putative ABC transport system permease protein